MSEDIQQRLLRAKHICARCLRTVERGITGARVLGGTEMRVQCHGRIDQRVVRDAEVEDSHIVWWFDGDDGLPVVTRAELRRRELAAELEKRRAKRAGDS